MTTEKWLTVPTAFAALTVSQFCHSIEEVVTGLYEWMPRVTGSIRERVGFIPRINVSRNQFSLVNVGIVMFMVTISVLLFRRIPWAVRVARAVAFVEILNGLAHIVAMIITRRYFPGAFSAVALIVCGVLFFRADRIEQALSRLDES